MKRTAVGMAGNKMSMKKTATGKAMKTTVGMAMKRTTTGHGVGTSAMKRTAAGKAMKRKAMKKTAAGKAMKAPMKVAKPSAAPAIVTYKRVCEHTGPKGGIWRLSHWIETWVRVSEPFKR